MRSARPRQASRTKALILPANWRGRRRPRRQSPSPGSADPSAPGKAHLVGAVLVAGDDAHPSAPGRRLRPPPAHGGKRPRSQPPHVPAVFSQTARAVCPASGRSASAQGTITIVPAEKDVSAPSSFRSAPGGDSAYSALSRASSAPPGRRWLQWLRKSRPAVGQGRCRGISEKPSRRRAGAMSRRFGKAVRAVGQGRAVARDGACRRRERAKNALRRRQGMAFPPSLLRGPLNSPPPPRRGRLGCRPARSCPGARCRRG